MYRLIGITDVATAARVSAARANTALNGLSVVERDGLAALITSAPKTGWFGGGSRETLARRLEEDQKRLEALIAFGPLLPAANDVRFESEADANDLMAASAESLAETLRDLGSAVQFQIEIGWKPELILKAHARDPDLLASLERHGEDRRGRGAAIMGFMMTLRDHLAKSFRDMAMAAARDIVMLPNGGETTIANFVVLIDRAAEARLDRAIEAIDAAEPGALSIRYKGPLPPISFACIDVKTSSPGEVDAACHLLGVDKGSSTATLRGAYVSRAREAHPDTRASTSAADPLALNLAALKAAYQLLAHAEAKSTARGRPAPLVFIRREGEVARRA
jgi:hypothetical protein